MAPKKYKPKKQQNNKSPYYFFMMEYKKKQEANGYVFRGGAHEIQQRASPYWNVNFIPFSGAYLRLIVIIIAEHDSGAEGTLQQNG